MPGFVIERNGFTNAVDLVLALARDMVANGFTLISPASIAGNLEPRFKILFEAGPTVDPLNATALTVKQPWRIMFDVQEEQTCFVYVGTPTTLPNNGDLPFFKEQGTTYGASSPQVLAETDVIGNVAFKMGNSARNMSSSNLAIIDGTGMWLPPSSGATAAKLDDPKYGLINRRFRTINGNGIAFPMTYRLVITDRGVWFGVWEDSESDNLGQNFNWVLVQRPVDRLTGDTVVTGKAPVWALAYNGPNISFPSQHYYHQTVVREIDVLRPAVGNLESGHRLADVNEADSDAVINPINQVALSEDGKYIITFPSRLNTNRYCYSHELDMIGYTSADVVSQSTVVPLTVYGESTAREYIALKATDANNKGMRIVVLTTGGGIS